MKRIISIIIIIIVILAMMLVLFRIYHSEDTAKTDDNVNYISTENELSVEPEADIEESMEENGNEVFDEEISPTIDDYTIELQDDEDFEIN